MSISDGTDTAQAMATAAPTYRQLGKNIADRIATEMPTFAAKFPPAELANVLTTALGQATGVAPADTAAPHCDAHAWCAEVGNHTMHASAYVQAPTLDGYGDCVLPANLMAEDGAAAFAPTVGFLDLNLTPDQTRARVTELHHHLDQVAGLADQIDGQAPLEPAAECYSVTAPGASGALISAEIFTSEDPQPGSPGDCIAVFGLQGADADLDVAGADQLIADLEEFLPRLRALRNHLAATVAGPEARP